MPKMPEAFYHRKREEILDAAQKIALDKPLSHVTMKDLIRACNVSQGAIYHYFSSLDEIWLGLIERFYQSDDVLEHLEQIFLQRFTPQETVDRCLRELCENLRRTIPVYGKLVMELNTLVQANPDRFVSLSNEAERHGRLDGMLQLFDGWCREQTDAGGVRPRVSREQLCLYLCSSYLGMRYHAAALYQQKATADTDMEMYLENQRQSWQLTILYLLGLE